MAASQMLTYVLDERGEETLTSFLYGQIRHDIQSGHLQAGQKLPSKRKLAKHLGISVITVEAAYVQLVSEGYLVARPRSGFFVVDLGIGGNGIADRLPIATPACATNIRPNTLDLGKSSASTGRAQIKTSIDLATNTMPIGVFPYKTWAKTLRDVLASNSERTIIDQVDPFGSEILRAQIAQYLRSWRGMDVDPNNIVVAAGSQTLYYLLIQLLGRHRIFAVEDPGYPRLTDIYRTNDVHLAHVPLDSNGIRVDLLSLMGADVAHVMPSHQFPTGVVTSISRRYELLAWASQAQDHVLVEDDYDAEFRLAGKPIPTLFGMDTTQSVVYINTFSQSLGGIFRIGYMVLPPLLAQEFRERLSFYSGTVSAIEQLTLARFIETGAYGRHINRLRCAYRNIRDELLVGLKESSIASVVKVSGEDAGLHFELELDLDVPTGDLVAAVARRGVQLVPMANFYQKLDDSKERCRFVLNYGSLKSESIPTVIAALEESVHEVAEI